MKKIIISILFTLSIMSVLSYGWFVYNWPCLLYNGQCPQQENLDNGSMGHLSIDAAGFFLQSNSDYQSFLKQIELLEIYDVNNEDLKNLFDNAIDNMEMAHSIYYQVWQISKNLEPNPVVLEKLNQFDYRLFQEDKKLIPSIFNEIESYLKTGNMPGAFEKIYNSTGDILQMMKSLKSIMESNSIDIPKCWELNQIFLRTEIFGQYVSQVFAEIKKSIM